MPLPALVSMQNSEEKKLNPKLGARRNVLLSFWQALGHTHARQGHARFNDSRFRFRESCDLSAFNGLQLQRSTDRPLWELRC